MRKKNFKNIGKVAINEIKLCDTSIGLYIPIEKMSEPILKEYESCEEMFEKSLKEEHPEIDLLQYTIYTDSTLHIHIEDCEVRYSVAFIIWIQDEAGKPIHYDICDPFDVEIDAEDNKYLKKLVMNKLIESFF